MPTNEEKKATRAQVVSAAKWGAMGTFARVIVQFVAQLVLVRLLGPEIFGIYAVGAIILGLSAFLVDMGIGPALVQKSQLSDFDIRFAYTIQLLIGVFFATLLYLAAPWLAETMNQAESAKVIQVLSLVCIINAASAVAQNLLRRNLNFKAIHIGQVASFLLSYFLVGVTLAVAGYGVWAIVAAVVLQNLIAAVWMLWSAPHPKKPLLAHPDGARSMVQFGALAFGTNLLNWAIGNIDRLVVARVFPGHGLGIYNTTYNLLLAPTGHVIGILQSILFPASARVQQERETLLAFCRAALNLGAILIVPTFLAIAAMSGPLVETLYGNAWLDAVPVLTAISCAMIPYCLMGILTPVIWGIGKVGLEGRVQFLSIGVLISVCMLASQISFAAVAWGVAFTFMFRFLAILLVFSKEFHQSYFSLLREISCGVIAGLCAMLMIAGLLHLPWLSERSSMLQTAIVGIVSLLALSISFPLVVRNVSFDGAGLLLQIAGNSTNGFAKWLRHELALVRKKVA